MKTRKLTKADLTDQGLRKLIELDMIEIGELSSKDIISIWSFYKFLITSEADTFITQSDGIIYRYKSELEKRGIHVMSLEEINDTMQ